MQIKLPIVESRFMVYLQIVGRKIYKYDSIDNIREQEFKRISKFRPLPELTVSSIPTLDVEEKERVDLSNVGGIESSRETLVETLNKGEALVVEREPEIREVSEPFKGSTTSEVNEDDKKYLDYERNVLEIPKNVKYEELDLNNDYKNSDKIIEVENSFTGDVFEDLALEEPTTVEDSLQVFLDSVEPCRLKLDLKDIYFGYLGLISPKEVTKVEVSKDGFTPKVVDTTKVGNPIVNLGTEKENQHGVKTAIVGSTVDKFVRRDGEDIVMYARRLVRVSEVEVLRYFSPRELEIALERGNLLRKRGVIIFAHA
jgi:hypothetical protein